MRVLTTSIVIGPLMLIGALPAAAGQSTLALGRPSQVSAHLLLRRDCLAISEKCQGTNTQRV
jgi:hypothetical protein